MNKKAIFHTIIKDSVLVFLGAVLGLIALLLVHLLPTDPMRKHVYWSLDMIEKEFEDEILIEGYLPTLTGNFTGCRCRGFFKIVAFVNVVVDLETVLFSGRRYELPEPGSLCWRVSARIEITLDACQVSKIGRNAVGLQYGHYYGEISVGAFDGEEGVAVGVDHRGKFTVVSFPEVGTVKLHLFSCKFHFGGNLRVYNGS